MFRRISVGRLPVAVRFALPLAAVASAAVACGSGGGTSGAAGSSPTAAPAAPSAGVGAVTVQTKSGAHGTYLTDQAGRALYLYTPDAATASNCTGACASLWPPLTTTGTPQVAGGVTAGKLATITRSDDGAKQVTYNGHPLYYFKGDTSAGQTNGEGLMKIWYLLTPTGTQITG